MEGGVGEVFRRSGSVSQGSSSGGRHTYSMAELHSFVEHVNRLLADKAVPGVPISPPQHLFEQQQDGVLFCHLITQVKKDAINMSLLRQPASSKLAAIGNQNLVTAGAQVIGCKLSNISAEDLYDKKEYLVLGVLWQIVKASLMQYISVKKHPELVRLAAPSEDLSAFLQLPPEGILLRWFNYHLRQAGLVKAVSNFASDIRDGHAYIYLLNQLLGEHCSLSLLDNPDPLTRAQGIVAITAAHLNCKGLISPQDIVQGVPKINLAFVAFMFNTKPGLQPPDTAAMRRLSMDRDQLEHRVQMLDSQLQSERLSLSVVEELRKELESSRSLSRQQADELVLLRRECTDMRATMLSSQTEALRMSSDHLPQLQRQVHEAEERFRQKESQLKEAEGAIRQMMEDNKVVQSQFALVVQERNRLRQGGDEDRKGLLEQIAKLQAQLECVTKEKETLQNAMEKTEEMVQHTQSVYERQAVHVSHLKILFASHQNPKSLALAIYKDLGVEVLLKQQGTRAKTGTLNRVYNDRRGGEEVKALFFLLKECFLFTYKPSKRTDPCEVLRVDDTLIDITTVPGQYFLMMSWINDSPSSTTVTFRFDAPEEMKSWHEALGTASEYWTGVKQRRLRR